MLLGLYIVVVYVDVTIVIVVAVDIAVIGDGAVIINVVVVKQKITLKHLCYEKKGVV